MTITYNAALPFSHTVWLRCKKLKRQEEEHNCKTVLQQLLVCNTIRYHNKAYPISVYYKLLNI